MWLEKKNESILKYAKTMIAKSTKVTSMKDEEEETHSELIESSSKFTQQTSSDALMEVEVEVKRDSEDCCLLISHYSKGIDDNQSFVSTMKSAGGPNTSLSSKRVINEALESHNTRLTFIIYTDRTTRKMEQLQEKSLNDRKDEPEDDCFTCRLHQDTSKNYVNSKSRFSSNQQKRPILEHLLKLFMFLMTILYSQQVFVTQANCQKHYFHHQNSQNQDLNQRRSQFFRMKDDQVLRLDQRQPFDQFLKNHDTNRDLLREQQQQQAHQRHHYRHHQTIPQVRISQPAQLRADRRASGGSSNNPSSPPPTTAQPNHSHPHSHSQFNQHKDSGKLLVCYYTTRQSAPYWPKDAREFVIPADGLNSINGDLSQIAPILQYEPFARIQNNQNNDATMNAQQASSDFPSISNIKNQQQQLVFKSAAMMQQSPQQHLTGGPGISSKTTLGGYNNGGNKSKQQQHNENSAISQILEQQQQHNPHITQQSLVINGPTIDNVFGSKNKQTPAYSFIGDLESSANNGLIVAGGGVSGTNSPSLPASVPISAPVSSINGASPLTQLNHGGNNGNNFINSKDANGGSSSNNNIGNHLERNSIKQQQQQASQAAQQLVFSPSLSRAFIVAANSGSSSSSNNNNETLDTKSQLFIPSLSLPQTQAQTQQAQTSHNQPNNNNNQFHQQTTNLAATTTSAATNLPALYQQHNSVSVQKAKSLQLTGSEQLSPVHPFSGPVSSTPPVPLSSASSSLAQHTTAASYRHSQHYQHHHHNQQQHFPPTANQLIVSSGVHTTSSNSGQKSPIVGATNTMPGMKLPTYQNFAANLVDNNLGGKSSPSSSSTSSSQTASIQSSLTNAPSSSSTSTNLAGSTPSLLPSSPSPSSSSSSLQSSSGTNGSGGGSLSSALVSSPLSTMFDVFGAASQYLMRFKPSSLISPASFTFNTIPNDHHHLHHPHHGLKPSNSSLLSSLSSGSPASLIPLPFSAGLAANMQKTSSSSPSNDPSSISNPGSVGVISRFALQNNQRREDVCGKTIQTPQRRIIGGEGARYGEFPYQVHIKIAKHQCGGALVDKQSIVTAAHCVYHFITRAPVSKLQIVIGAYDIEDEQYQELPPQYFKVNKVKLHPNFRFSASHPDRYDIAILKLDKPVKYTDNVLPVCLPSKDLKFESMVGTVTGFGKTDPSLSNRYGTRLLQKVDVPIIENNECERWHRTRGIDLKIFPEMMCAGYEDGLKDACVGDSGGPLVVKTAAGSNGSFRWTLAGITSAGFGCAQSRQPGIYHRVSHTVDWILENLD